MEFHLPELGQEAVSFLHFPTVQQAFIFRAYEFASPERIARILNTSAQTVEKAAADMGLTQPCQDSVWLQKGYITIIRSLWHILNYEQLLSFLDMDRDSFAKLLREEDFLDVKMGRSKPICPHLTWRELTQQEQEQTEQIRRTVSALDVQGAKPFAFDYAAEPMQFSGKPLFKTRLIYGFSNLYQNALEVDSEQYCPDSLLQAYGALGINALWIPVALHDISEFPFDPSLSRGYETRLARLRQFAQRCDTFGLKLFIYLNEPRSLPVEFYEKHPELKGHVVDSGRVCLCTSTKEVQDYLTNNVAFVCRNVPNLGGIFTITRSENVTNCYSHSLHHSCSCPRCSQRTMGQVIGEVISCYEKGAHSVNPDIRVIAWSWAWEDNAPDIIANLPANVILQSTSETHIPFTIGGVDGVVRDYSMSIVGPGELARKEWQAAKARGLEISAKVQINTTWECSTVPAVPVYDLVEQHMQNLQREGVGHIMLSWTLGGYPSQNIRHAAKYFYEQCHTQTEETAAQQEAVHCFSEAFREFPFLIDVLYYGPQNGGISNLLYLEPTGYRATMTCYAYDDLERWRKDYPEETFEAQFAKLCDRWQQGLALLTDDGSELFIMAKAAYIQFQSCLNQIRFYRARSRNDRQTMKCMAQQELVLAKDMLALMNRTPILGFEAANHYYFSKGNIVEKIVNCEDISQRLS